MKGTWKDWRIWIGIALLFAIGWALKSGQGQELYKAFQVAKGFSIPTLAASLGLCTLQVLLMGMRTWALAPSKTRVQPVLWAISYGQLANAFFPARAGDALKVAILGDNKQGAGIPYVTATGVLIADKIVDLAGIVLLLVATQAYKVHAVMPEFPHLDFTILVLILLAHSLVFLFWRYYFKARAPKFDEKLKQFRKGLKTLLVPRHLLPALCFSTATWFCEMVAIQTVSAGLGYPFSFPEIAAVLVVLNLAISIPISVANLGTFEASVVYALGKLAVPLAPAIAIAVVHHLMQLLGTACGTAVARILRRRVL